jgi:hypothetical protein
MLDYGHDPLGLHRVQAACGPDNVASHRVPVKLGFRPEGRMRDHVFTNGAWRDSLLYSHLDDAWASARKSQPLVIAGAALTARRILQPSECCANERGSQPWTSASRRIGNPSSSHAEKSEPPVTST